MYIIKFDDLFSGDWALIGPSFELRIASKGDKNPRASA